MISLFIKGIAIPQERPRARVIKNGPNPYVIMYDPKKSKDWKVDVAKQAKILYEGKPLDGLALKVELVFWMLKPKSYPKSVVHHVKKPDVDNLAKGVCDALNGILYKDDSQIVSMNIRKAYCEENPGVQVKVELVETPF